MAKESTISSKMVFEGRAVKLKVDDVLLANGVKSVREVVEHPGAVAVIALDENEDVIMVEQYRYSVGETLLEIPAGTLKPNENIFSAARRELSEETGFDADLEHLLSFYTSPGILSEYLHVFWGKNIRPINSKPDFDEDINVIRVPFLRALDYILNGKIKDAKSIIALLALARIRKL